MTENGDKQGRLERFAQCYRCRSPLLTAKERPYPSSYNMQELESLPFSPWAVEPHRIEAKYARTDGQVGVPYTDRFLHVAPACRKLYSALEPIGDRFLGRTLVESFPLDLLHTSAAFLVR